MTTIKIFTRQNYEKNLKSPSEIVFYKDETDLVKIISLHLAKSFKDSIEITKNFLSLPDNVDIYEVETDKNVLYIIKSN